MISMACQINVITSWIALNFRPQFLNCIKPWSEDNEAASCTVYFHVYFSAMHTLVVYTKIPIARWLEAFHEWFIMP